MYTLPSVRSFVVVNFDPVATVSHLDNPELTAACRKLETKKYVAYVSLAVGLIGLRQNEAKGITEGMSVPILPNTSHPSSRRPMHPDKPLLWDDCYVSRPFFTAARFPTVFLGEVPETRIEVPMKEARKMERYMRQDVDEMKDFAWRTNTLDARDRSNRHENEVVENQHDASHNRTHSEHHTEQNIHDDANSIESDFDPIEEHNAIVMRQVVLNASFNLSEVEQPNDPADLFEEIRVFRQLYEDLEVGRKQRDIERARQVDEAYFASLSKNAYFADGSFSKT
ncbi:hypothetical protein Moror_3900 [Moniliophthora roreri MCA 2997]|uniref:Uncharacterized protein n=1 Tax=Moniliophthora roreri (strain MCA 2997) TaxID=1381753 RepID=V2X818_MONRO|nr:hypothetical protein Moror_3900 [Moniliophthora roreri MCA 2997]